MNRRHVWWKLVLMAVGVVALSGCETLRALLTVEQPDVRVVGAALTELSFEGAEITVDLELENPNGVGISLRGIAYELFIEGERFLSGDLGEAVEIGPETAATLSVPVGFEFQRLLATMGRIRDLNEANYSISFDIRFELPVLGETTIPIRTEGTFPVLRLPAVRLSALVLQSIGLSGAELELALTVSNPNAIAVRLESLAYELQVQGETWVEGRIPRPQSIAALSDSTIEVPFTLRFLSMGRTARTMLMGADAIDYRLGLTARVGTELGLVPEVALPLVLEGSVPLDR